MALSCFAVAHTVLFGQFSSGVGFQTALQLAKRGAKVYLGCRSEARAKDAIGRMHKASPGLDLEARLVWLPLDLSEICEEGWRRAVVEGD